MTAPILLQPKPQFSDANGKPYAGGRLYTYVKGTTTPKATWKDPEQAAVNTDPIVLDAAGRCDMWGDGDYQLELHDAAGNLIWNVPSTTVVSAAMYPVVGAPTTTDAMTAMGVTGAINAEATARAAQDTAETNARTSADTAIYTSISNNVAVLETVDNQEAAARAAADNALQGQINAITGTPATYVQGGVRTLNFTSASHGAVLAFTFPLAFATGCDAVVVTATDEAPAGYGQMTFAVSSLTRTGCTVVGLLSAPPAFAFTAGFNYISIGH